MLANQQTPIFCEEADPEKMRRHALPKDGASTARIIPFTKEGNHVKGIVGLIGS